MPRQHASDFEAVLAGALVVARRPETGETLVGAARFVILDAWTAAIVAPAFSELSRFAAAARAAGTKLPVAIVLGGDPAYAVLGAAPLPPRLDAWTFAGWLRGAPVELSNDGPSGCAIPADAEIVIEGTISGDEPPNLVPPIRYVESTGEMYDVPLEDRLLLRISTISHRSSPLVPLVRIGSSEEELLRRAAVSLGRAWIKTEVPELTGLSIPGFGGPRGFVFAAFQKRRPFHARRVAAALFAQSWLDSAYIVLVDSDVDVHNPDQVWAQVARFADPARDLIAFDAPPQPFSPTRRLAIDATRKTSAERDRASPSSPASPAELVKRVQDRWWEYGLGAPPK
ncbi:MAG TPA: UbiD family decarboxylase [Pirellulales bacterium]